MQPVRKFNYANHPLNLPQHGLGTYLNKNKPGVGAIAGVGAGMIDQLNPDSKVGGDIASGALSGAAAGMALGPIGAGVGALVGGVVSLFTHKAQERAKARAAAEVKRVLIENTNEINNDATSNILRNFSTSGIDRPRAGRGGKVGDIISAKIVPGQADYLAENGEVIQFDPRKKPATDKFGKLSPTSSDSAVIKGATHEAASGGVGMTGGERIFSNDDKLKVPKDFSKILKRL